MDTHEKEYYKTLNLPRTASLSEIKDTYKKLALKWHPDKNPHNREESKQVFQRISEAYSILSDPEKRRKYDKYGTVEDFDFDFDQFMKEFDFSDMFDLMFQGMKHIFGGKRSHGRNMRHFHFDFDKHMQDFKHKKEKMKKDEKSHEHKEQKEWETEEEEEVKEDDFEDISDEEEEEAKPIKNINKKKKSKKIPKEEIDMFYMPMFLVENTVELKKKAGFKCKFDGEILKKEQDMFRHFEKDHKSELEKFIEENQDLENGGMDMDLLGEMGLGDMGFLEDMMDPMFFGGLNGKKKKKGKK